MSGRPSQVIQECPISAHRRAHLRQAVQTKPLFTLFRG